MHILNRKIRVGSRNVFTLHAAWLPLVLLVVAAPCGCSSNPPPPPNPTPTHTPTVTITPTITDTPTITSTFTDTATPTDTPTITNTPTITATAPSGTYAGEVLSAVPTSPIPLGSNLTIHCTVRNTGSMVWRTDLGAAGWKLYAFNYSWNPSPSVTWFIWRAVDPDATDSHDGIIPAAILPSSPGDYHLTIRASYYREDTGTHEDMQPELRVDFTISGP